MASKSHLENILYYLRTCPFLASQLGKLEVTPGGSDTDTREQLIKNHFAGRVNELTSQLQTADSKAVNFLAEVLYRLNFFSEKKTVSFLHFSLPDTTSFRLQI